MTFAAGVESRNVAWQALLAWEKSNRHISDSIASSKIEPQEKAFATEIAMVVVRNKTLLEYNLKRWAPKNPAREQKYILLMALAQLWHLNAVPPHAIVSTAVDLAKTVNPKVGKFVNAVLRKAMEEKQIWPSGKSLKNVAIRYSHPGWMVQKWMEELGFSKMVLRLRRNQEIPQAWLRVRLDKTSMHEVAHTFTLNMEEQRFDQFIPFIGNIRDLLKHPYFLEGKVSIQEPSAGFLIQLLDLQDDSTVLDVCSAPGGKTAYIRENFPKVKVVSADFSPKRLQKLADHKHRLQLPVQSIAQDGKRPAFKKQSFSHILVDAPCSNLGVINRRPEARWHVTPKSMKSIAEEQLKILEGCVDLLKPGGALVFSTCSPEPEETTEVINAFLNLHPNFELESARKFIHRRYTYEGCFRIIPAPGSLDGFFGARLVKQ